ncbi:MAG: phage integrase N-terminal SAM-like domain-containing protein [Pseudohongiellaceae bacterium]
MPASPFMETLRQHMLARHYSKRTIDSYLYWIWYYICFNSKRVHIQRVRHAGTT